jgi:hypothetical protein
LAPPVIFSHSGAWPSYFVDQNKTTHNFAPFTTITRGSGRLVVIHRLRRTRYQSRSVITADRDQVFQLMPISGCMSETDGYLVAISFTQ